MQETTQKSSLSHSRRNSEGFINLEIGPGSYEISSKIGTTSMLYKNSPQVTISNSKIPTNQYINKPLSHLLQGTQSPGFNIYSPNASLTYRSETKFTFPKSKRESTFIKSQLDRSPGPIYNSPKPIAPSVNFSKAQRYKMFERYDSPSPTSYNPKLSSSSSMVTIKSAQKTDKIYAKNYERYLKGKLSPGPGCYNLQSFSNLIKGGIFSKVGRDAGEKLPKLPGPGDYETGRKILTEKGSFYKGKKKLDVRDYAKSFELFKN
ncbi:unnamed protein product [Blepharisma stoltei]|uniref:Uncharacterized protein n=1 Tax=Blepharisma stoltei TaxID=1481888 RepID=A0AAU9ICT0_9CILI|nr:unnamed protein product [Blepharisma stoltei]